MLSNSVITSGSLSSRVTKQKPTIPNQQKSTVVNSKRKDERNVQPTIDHIKPKGKFSKKIFPIKWNGKNNDDNTSAFSVSNALLMTLNMNECAYSGIGKREIPIILINGEELKESDIYIKPKQECCLVGGDGLMTATVDKPNKFYIESESEFEYKKITVTIKGPRQAAIKMESTILDENLCCYTYWPRKPGVYAITIKWEKEHVLGSPFYVKTIAE